MIKFGELFSTDDKKVCDIRYDNKNIIFRQHEGIVTTKININRDAVQRQIAPEFVKEVFGKSFKLNYQDFVIALLSGEL